MTTTEDERDQAILEATRGVIAEVEAAANRWRFSGDATYLPLSAAGLLRASQMLDEALTLALKPPSIGANVLVRAAFECWLLAAWSLFGEDDALLGIELYRIEQSLKLVKANGAPARVTNKLKREQAVYLKACDNMLGKGKRPRYVGNLSDLAKHMPPLIKAKLQEDDEPDLLQMYDLLYRTHSTFDAHPAKPMGDMIKEDATGTRVARIEPWKEPIHTTGMMATYVGLLGGWLAKSMSDDTANWDACVQRLHDAIILSK